MHIYFREIILFLTNNFVLLRFVGFDLFTGYEGPYGEQRYSSTLVYRPRH
jgi:hypothetical protein